MNPKMIVAIYARVSTTEQDETLQLPRLRDAARSRGFEVYREYMDEASGKDANRPGWKALMADARAGCFSAVLVVKLDRVMRSLQLFYQELEQFSALGVEIISLDQGVLNPSSASGKLTIAVLASVAEWEREINSERTREALRAKREAGVVLGRPKADLPLRRIALMRLRGESWRAISRATGVPPSTMRSRADDINAEIRKVDEETSAVYRAGAILPTAVRMMHSDDED